MELRFWLAYGIIAVAAVLTTVIGMVAMRRRARRRLRMRGIKKNERMIAQAAAPRTDAASRGKLHRTSADVA